MVLYTSGSKRASQVTVCTSNLHQLGQAIAMYTADWDGGMPFAPDPLSKSATGDNDIFIDPILHLTAIIPYEVRELLAAYGCEKRVYQCPLDQNDWKVPEKGQKPTYFEECGSSYWYDDKHALIGYKIDSYPTPATNVIMSDYDFSHLGADPDINLFTEGTTNLLFADFHVKSYSWQNRTEFLEQVP